MHAHWQDTLRGLRRFLDGARALGTAFERIRPEFLGSVGLHLSKPMGEL